MKGYPKPPLDDNSGQDPPPPKRIKLEDSPVLVIHDLTHIDEEPEAKNGGTAAAEINAEVEGAEEDGEGENCAICLQPLVDRAVLPVCAHEFCFECILIWSEQSRKCPLCTAALGPYLIHHIRSRYDYQKYYLPPPPPRPHSPSARPAARRARAREIVWGRRERERRERERTQADELERAVARRRWIYEHNLYAKHVASNPFTKYRAGPTPAQFAASPDLISRLTIFLRRELRVWPHLDIEFLTTFIISLMKSLDIRSEGALRLLSEFLDMDSEDGSRKNAEHFAHEVYSYLRSPFRDLAVWDSVVQYDNPPQCDDLDTASSRRNQRAAPVSTAAPAQDLGKDIRDSRSHSSYYLSHYANDNRPESNLRARSPDQVHKDGGEKYSISSHRYESSHDSGAQAGRSGIQDELPEDSPSLQGRRRSPPDFMQTKEQYKERGHAPRSKSRSSEELSGYTYGRSGRLTKDVKGKGRERDHESDLPDNQEIFPTRRSLSAENIITRGSSPLSDHDIADTGRSSGRNSSNRTPCERHVRNTAELSGNGETDYRDTSCAAGLQNGRQLSHELNGLSCLDENVHAAERTSSACGVYTKVPDMNTRYADTPAGHHSPRQVITVAASEGGISAQNKGSILATGQRPQRSRTLLESVQAHLALNGGRTFDQKPISKTSPSATSSHDSSSNLTHLVHSGSAASVSKPSLLSRLSYPASGTVRHANLEADKVDQAALQQGNYHFGANSAVRPTGRLAPESMARAPARRLTKLREFDLPGASMPALFEDTDGIGFVANRSDSITEDAAGREFVSGGASSSLESRAPQGMPSLSLDVRTRLLEKLTKEKRHAVTFLVGPKVSASTVPSGADAGNGVDPLDAETRLRRQAQLHARLAAAKKIAIM